MSPPARQPLAHQAWVPWLIKLDRSCRYWEARPDPNRSASKPVDTRGWTRNGIPLPSIR